MRAIYLVLIVFLFAACTTSKQLINAKGDIQAVLSSQAAAWNNGDIEGYMKEGYWNNDSLLFIGKNGPVYGYRPTLEKYKKSYTSKEQMGKLSFSEVKIDMLSKENAYVVGKWELERSVGDVGGYFTLLFRKIGGKWVIVADHTS
jgi:ketosteroid isomerase-like protein